MRHANPAPLRLIRPANAGIGARPIGACTSTGSTNWPPTGCCSVRSLAVLDTTAMRSSSGSCSMETLHKQCVHRRLRLLRQSQDVFVQVVNKQGERVYPTERNKAIVRRYIESVPPLCLPASFSVHDVESFAIDTGLA